MSLSFPTLPFQLALNPGSTLDADYGEAQSAVLNAQGLAEARACVTAWPGYAPTPLVPLQGLASAIDIGAIHYKQEAERFGLRSFKPLGGAYAVQRCLMRVVAETTGRDSTDPREILDGNHADITAKVTVTAATDGNHGRSVAWGARMLGCRCVIYINEAVTPAREQAIAAYGAEVRRHPGSYDDAVRETFATALRESWHVIPDTSDGVVVDAPRHVTQGYAILAAEAIEQWQEETPPTHLFLQAGVGGMAAAVCAQYWQAYGTSRPTTIIVEPEQAACWFESLSAGRPTVVAGEIDSFMSGLACGELSDLAWAILQPGAHAAMTLNDAAAEATMKLLAQGQDGDRPLVGGESGVAGLAGLITLARDPDARQTVGLDAESRVLVVGSEGATDEALYEQVVGTPWQRIAA